MRRQLLSLFMMICVINSLAQNMLTSPFTLGFLGDASANNAATNCVYIQNVGITKVQFIQDSPQQIYVSQGNDIPGGVKLTDAIGTDYLIPGFIKWRAPSGNNPSTMVFKPNTGVNQNVVILNNGQNQVYNISPAKYIGLTFSGQTLSITNGQVSGNSASMLNILNQYVSTLAKITISNLTVAEEDGTANVLLSITGDLSQAMTVDYSFINGTALNGSDFIGNASTLSIPIGSSSASISVPIIDNSIFESTEQFNLFLNNPQNASISGGTSVVSILDSDSMVYGCMDTTACNFNPCAFQDNGTCTYPNAETCNGLDDDCDGNVDNGFSLNTYYADQDADNYGNSNSPILACIAGPGMVAVGGDCDDADANLNPGVSEICNNVDDNCDGVIDNGFDLDNDSWTTCEGDCNDNDPTINPGVLEGPFQAGSCDFIDNNCDGIVDEYWDQDQDTYTVCEGDCDDFNDQIHPGVAETCNNIDDNCNSQIDENLTQYPVYTDADGDGYGIATGTTSCTPSTIQPGDCNDTNSAIKPSATETCNIIDDNCNSQIDENLTQYLVYTDADGDGYGIATGTTSCTPSAIQPGDCNDTNSAIKPNAVELCNNIDDNCNIQIDENLTQYPVYTDADGDGYGAATGTTSCTPSTIQPGDCNDTNSAIKPSATETCNNIDDNCNSQIDENLTQYPVYTDADGDGYGVETGANTCTPSTIQPGDCNDTNSAIKPNAVELCNNIDDNCNIQIDENLTQYPVYTDADGDGYGIATGTTSCTPSTIQPGDCNDTNSAIKPSATETCNNIDDNCNSQIDENLTQYPVYTDADGDGYGVATGTSSCTPSTIQPGDCNDTNSAIKPGATETCNNIDDNCNNQVDENLTQYPVYTDADGDGYGVATGTTSCTPSTIQPGDCNDTNSAIKPGATETCNNIDDNCNSQIDENLTQYPVYTDADGDGYGVETGANTCTPSTIQPGDCNDTNSAIKPNAVELCNNIDDNCNIQIDENLTQYPVYTDADGDGYGAATGTTSCTPSTIQPGDCNDTNSAIKPGATETCNTIDDNCNNQVDESLISGCTDFTAFNYNPDANCDNGQCIPRIYGCTNAEACNYVPSANTDDSTCVVLTIESDTNNFCGNQPVVLNAIVTGLAPNSGITMNNGPISGFTGPFFFENSSYYISSQSTNWASANDAAIAMGGQLAVINSNDELNYVKNLIGQNGVAPWIGLTQDVNAPDFSEPAGGWYWTNGVPFAFNWDLQYDTEPNNCIACCGSVENAGQFYSNGTFNDLCINTNTRYLVEFNQSASYSIVWSNGMQGNQIVVYNNGTTTYTANLTWPGGQCARSIAITTETPALYYTDADGDGYGDINAIAVESCTAPEGTVDNNDDCDDNNALINPTQTEVCNDVDDNCNGQSDEGLIFVDYFTDSDLDGYGTTPVLNYCLNPGTGYTTTDGDCDDLNPAINPAAIEICGNDVDENCDGQVGEGCVPGCIDALACNYNVAATYDDGSCVYPQPEICNNIDDNCNTEIDENLTQYPVYADVDGDGYGVETGATSCEPSIVPPGDCDDSNASISPEAIETCGNDIDENCDGQVGEGCVAGCIDASACNYNVAATYDDGSCVYPQPEICNGIDDNCNTEIDENLTQYPVYTDVDGDGYGVETGATSCEPSIVPPGDCDDSNASISPEAIETCGNGVDENCDGQVGEGCVPGCIDASACNYNVAATYDDGSCVYPQPEICNDIDDNCNSEIDENLTQYPVYADVDGDGYGVETGATSCEPSIVPPGDCDDSNASISPEAIETCGNDVDENCDGQVGEGCVPGCIDASACNYDAAATYDDGSCVYPQPEICNGIDDNCNTEIDENLTQYPVYTDVDGDGYGVETGATSCEPSIVPPGDCDDSNASISPEAIETCGNDVDENCDGQVGEGCVPGCIDASACNYNVAATYDDGSCVYPQPEICNGIDDNCNTEIDENLTQYPVYVDVDGDGYGVETGATSCEPSIVPPGDCDDSNASISPEAIETCGNDVDENCDGQVGEGCVPGCTDVTACNFDEAATYDDGSCTYATTEICNNIDDDCDGVIDNGVLTTYYIDADADGYGDINDSGIEACTAPEGTVDNNDDCDDNNASINPVAVELCNNIDDNCNTEIDENLTQYPVYVDVDGDGYGVETGATSCEPSIVPPGDCDDSNASIGPEAIETCGNDIDENCDGQVGEGCVPGCIDASACNYNVAATYDDGSCVYPQPEICNDIDDNCDGVIDEGVKTMYYIDGDGDGYGDVNAIAVESCTAPEGTVDNNDDCDDSNALVNPAQIEVCNDVDDNCNGQSDEGLIFVDYFTDSDLDGYGTTPVLNYCLNPGTGYTTTDGDCDDLNPAINPAAIEICGNDIDENCDGQVGEGCVPGCIDASACNYNVAATYDDGSCVYPQPEICNDIDDNCDGVIDEGVKTMYYVDADGDGYGDVNAIAVESCTAPEGTVDNNTDCDDSNALVNPAQSEVCNDVDDNCNGQIDEGLTFVDYYTDSDLDGYGTTPVLNYCLNPGLGYTTTSGDCDDLNPAINPAAIEICGNDIDENCDGQVGEGCVPGCIDASACNYNVAATYDDGSCVYPQAEICNGIDDNCNNQIDENLTQYPVYVDVDGDGYGVETGATSCEPSIVPPGDCDDSNASISPEAIETCGNDVDENCDGQVGEGCVPGCIDASACNYNVAATYDDGSCVYPQAEICNGIDDNCNNQIDENLTQYPVYVDVDGDGYGVETGATSCEPSIVPPGDCDDSNASISPDALESCGNDIDENCDGQVGEGCVPGCIDASACNYNVAATYDDGSCVYPQPEICNGIDDDCDGVIDEGVKTMYYVDADGDGYGDINSLGVESCTAPEGTVDNNEDCDDNNALINPAQSEVCNDVDDNCNGQSDEGLIFVDYFTDSDLDGYGTTPVLNYCLNPGTGYTTTDGDCDDLNPAINPAATEICGNDVDENCDGQVGDGCVPGCTDVTACNFDEAATYDDGSCVYAQPEICNDIDDDCDGVIDNGVLTTYYVDADGDGYGDINDGGIEACTAPEGTVDNNEDCDDNNALINPAQSEVCNDVDDNCNGQSDEGLIFVDYFTDSDLDGYGTTPVLNYCLNPGTGYTTTDGDCDDLNPAINPAATEICGNDVDENCDGQVGEGCVPGCTDVTACNFDEAATYDDGSCVYAQPEICNDIDDNCDGVIDEGVKTMYYVDADGDGYGDINSLGVESCTAPEGTVDNNEDCDDNNALINPVAVELCNNIDDNCNTEIDENLTQYPVYADVDGDGYGVETGATSCEPSIVPPGDCDDSNASISPDAIETCGNDIDENCDGQVGDGCVPGCTDVTACNFDPAATEDDGSCVLPQPEICNDIDDDCDGQVNEGYSIESLNATTVNTAYFPACTPTNIFSANPFLGANTATIEGEGKDRWYKWTAQYNSLRIGLSAAIGDYSIHLYREYPGCLALEMIEHEVTTGNQTLITDELTVGANYYFAVHEHAGPGNTSAKLCINHFLPSDCDHYYSNGTGEYASVCGSFKTLYRGNANDYMINVLSATQNGQNLGIQPWMYQAGSSSVIARLGSILPSNLTTSPIVYTVNVPVMYSIPDAAENYTPVFAQATSTCTITLLPQTPIQVRASDRCPNIKAINSYIAPDQTICGSSAYQWEFTDCSAGLQNATTQVLTGANGSSVFMLNNIPGVAPGKFYQVRVRPIHNSGFVAAWGPVQCVMIQGSGMVAQETSSESMKVSDDLVNALVYPNPTTTGDLNIVFEKPVEGELTIQITNLLGQTVYTESSEFSGIAHKLDLAKLSRGIFQLNIRINGMEQTERLVRD